MRKFDYKGQIHPIIFLIAFFLILATVGAVYLILSRPIERVEFSFIKLEDSEISVGETTTMQLRVKNNSGEDYQSVFIQLATESTYLDMYYPDVDVTKVGGETRLTLSVGLLRSKEETKKYVVDIIGKELPSGILLVEAEIKARILADGEKTDERTYVLRIKSE